MRWLLPLLLPLLAASLEAAESPRLDFDADNRLVLSDLPPILAEEEVEQHLTTGLTTSVYFRLGDKFDGGGRVDIRYDLWDEVFQVVAVGADRRIQRARSPSFDELLEWWQSLRLVILERDRLPRPWPRRLRVTADVVPFSAAEQDDARRWFSESIEEGRRAGTDEIGRSGEQPTETLSRTFNLLLATSIRRRALASFPWNVTLPVAGATS